ncbi:MAG: response regulator [Myxococcaceae bacterium]|nr:response regulator [Myxococcaceae bacterium]
MPAVILISDDDPRVARSLARQLLRLRLPVRVEIDCSGQLVEVARAVSPSLVVLDILQPVPGLLQLAALRRDPLLGDTPVVAISAVDDDRARSECLRHGVIDFVLKPFPELIPEKLALLALRPTPEAGQPH